MKGRFKATTVRTSNRILTYNEPISPMTKVLIHTPRDINSSRVKEEVREAISSGVKTNEIKLVMSFIAPDAVLSTVLDDFRKMKNRMSFELNKQP